MYAVDPLRGSVITGVLGIKNVRERCRLTEKWYAERALEQATQTVQRVKDDKHRRDQERKDRERKLYDDVCSRQVKVIELQDLNHEVDKMKSDAKADANKVEEAQEQRQQRRKTYEDATGAWHLAAQAMHKFKSLYDEEREERAKYLEWQADLELEEHPCRSAILEALEDTAPGM